MITIPDNFGAAGRGLAPSGVHGEPTLRDVLRELQALSGGFTVASADGVAAAGTPPTKAEYDPVVVLVNEMKTVLGATGTSSLTMSSPDAAASAADPPVKVEFDVLVALVNEEKTKVNALDVPTLALSSPDAVAAVADPITKAEFDAVVTLANEIKTALNAYNT